jgi:aminopeptidase N
MKNNTIIVAVILVSLIRVDSSLKAQIIPKNISGVSIELAQFRRGLLSKINYNLSFIIPDSINQSIKASEEITFNLSQIVNSLEIDFKESIDHLLSIDVNGMLVQINFKNEHIIIPGELLVKGTNIIRINFFAGDQSLNRNEEFLFTLLVPERARTFFPCFDQPNLKATFTLTATVPKDWDAISNGRIKNVSNQADRKIFKFNTSDKISTYMFSLVAGKFQKVSRVINGKEVNFYHRETDSTKIKLSVDSIFDLHKQALDFMKSYTGIEYPFQKFDFIAIPDFQYGGMEHVGAIDYRAESLFLDKSSTINDKIERAHVIAHETAHMWFGNLVTMEWFNDVWMKEVFANFMADKILNVVMPDSNIQKRFLLEHHPRAYNTDRTEGTHPIRQTLTNLDHAGTLYGNIIYQKAPIVMKQLEKIIGENIMQQGLKKYLLDFSFKNADWTELIKILDKFSIEDISTWNNQWINKKGRPVLTYQMIQSEGAISLFTISQRSQNGASEIWKQHFKVAFIYDNSVKTLNVNMNDSVVVLKEALGLTVPRFILFNATGEGYGLFPIDRNMLSGISSLEIPVMRASAYLNIYESVLEGRNLTPTELLMLYGKKMNEEPDMEILNRISKQFKNIYWQFITTEEREKISIILETNLWNAIQNSPVSNKKILLETYISIALSSDATDKIYGIWKSEKPPGNISLSEENYTSMASELVIRNHPQTANILSEQLKRIKNPDRKLKFEYLFKALSNDVTQRTAYFESLSDKKNREKEVWVTTALGYLHHPLRAKDSEKYLPKTLQLLVDIRLTGDIFFPSDWISASFSYYQSVSARDMVQTFLQINSGYDESLKRVILQETDDLFRVQRILNK